MSWDVSLVRFSRTYRSIAEVSSNENPIPLGRLQEIQMAVSEVFLGTNWDDPSWGIYDCEFGSIEFNVGQEDPVNSLCLHVRAGDGIVGGILLLCQRLSCQAVDFTDGSFLDQSERPAANLAKWREYRDHIVGKSGRQ